MCTNRDAAARNSPGPFSVDSRAMNPNTWVGVTGQPRVDKQGGHERHTRVAGGGSASAHGTTGDHEVQQGANCRISKGRGGGQQAATTHRPRPVARTKLRGGSGVRVEQRHVDSAWGDVHGQPLVPNSLLRRHKARRGEGPATVCARGGWAEGMRAASQRGHNGGHTQRKGIGYPQ